MSAKRSFDDQPLWGPAVPLVRNADEPPPIRFANVVLAHDETEKEA
jgi:hypothetical protein